MLATDAANEYMSVAGYAGPDASYWRVNFAGERMSEDWPLPPLKILGKSKKLGDFVGWTFRAPIVSARAKDVLQPLVREDVHFLPFHELRGKPYFAMNVLRVEDYLDNERSEGQRWPDGTLLTYHRYVFRENLPADLPPIFKVTPSSSVFVTRRFADAIVQNKLTGACLQDPYKGLTLVARGEQLNVYPGVL